MTRPWSARHRFWDDARRSLRSNRTGVEIRGADLTIRAGDLPVFRRGDSGLLQAVRVAVEEGGEDRDVSFRLGDGRVRVEATAHPGGPRAVTLLVPEVQRPTRMVLEASIDGSTLVEAPIEVRPQRKYRIFCVHQSHLDIGYTDPQNLVLRHQAAYLDAVLDLVTAHADAPDDARFRWNVESTWPLEHWLATRPAPARRTFFDAVRAGLIEICALPFNMHTEAYSIDELARQLTMADSLREHHGVDVVTAMQTDVPGAAIGLLNLLTDAGVRYLSVAHNYAGRSIPHSRGGDRLSRPFRWRAQSGRELLVWYTDTPLGVAYMEGNLLGLAEGYDLVAELLPEYLAALAQRPYPFAGPEAFGWFGAPPAGPLRSPYPHDVLHLRVQGEHADNAPPSGVPASVVARWNEEWAYPRLRMATNREFFEAVERELGGGLDVFEGDWTDWWADGIGSAAREVAFGRLAQTHLPVAQTMHLLADVAGQPDAPDWPEELDRAYRALALFDEHTWGAANPWEDALEWRGSGVLQWQRKAAFAREAYDRATELLAHGTRRLGSVLAAGDGSTVVVVNPGGRARTDLAEVFVPEERLRLDGGGHLVDEATGRLVPAEVRGEECRQDESDPDDNCARYRPRGRWLRFLARDVPACGFRRYRLQRGAAAGSEGETRTPDSTLENERYRVEVDIASGTVRSLIDLGYGREIVFAGSLFGFNQYVYDRYASAPHFNHLSGRIPEGGPWLLGGRAVASRGVVVARTRTAVADRLTVRLVGEGSAWVESTVELARGVDRVDFHDRLQKLPTPDKESVYFAFPFQLDPSRVLAEITGGADADDSPRIPGSARHMRAIRHWLALDAPDGPVAWATGDAPLVQMGMLHLPYAPFPPTFEAEAGDRATVFSWAMNNIWDTNFPVRQGGEAAFRFAVSAGPSGADARRLGRETAAAFARPLAAVLCPPGTVGGHPAAGSFCEISGGNVDLVTVAPSRDHGLAVHLHSLEARTAEVALRLPAFAVRRAWAGSCLEREPAELPVDGDGIRVSLAPGQYRVVALDLEGPS
jgi:Glycosyl hydrolases family 38 N-terminal domain